MKKRIFLWDGANDKRYNNRKCPNFDFLKACELNIVIWWDERSFCVDMDRIDEVRTITAKPIDKV